MPSPHERYRNNVKMGVFVSASLLIALLVVVALADAWTVLTMKKTEYKVSFTLETGVTNLKKGSEVRVGGMKLGEVVSVKPRFEPGEPFEYIDVTFTVDANVELYTDAHVQVTAPLIGSDAWIDIPSVGDPASGRPVNNELDGRARAGMLATMLGPENAARLDSVMERVDDILADAKEFSSMLARVPKDYDERILPMIDNAGLMIDNAGIMVEDAKGLVARIRHEDWPVWKALVDRILANVEDTSENLQEFMAWVNHEGREKLIDALDRGRSALAHADTAMETLRRDYDVWATDLGVVLANASHASQQLKLAMTEIRRAPWKLIHVPGKEELEHELLYDSVRAFALAAADLRSAAIAVQRVLETHGHQLAGDPEAMERLQQNLLEPLARYEQAQQQLLNILLEK